MLDNVFTVRENEAGATSTRMLTGTAELTRLAANATEDAMHKMNDNAEAYNEKLQQSFTDMGKLDELINELVDIKSMDLSSVANFDEETVTAMLKSQQSKRSRCKSKEMTMDNYKSMMTAAIAESIIRLVYDKPKTFIGSRSFSLDITDEMLAELKEDQEALGRAIRNVQSKKSMEKAKEDFSEDSERWQQLLEAEAKLKSVRVAGGAGIKSKVKELIGDVDIDSLKAADAKDILKSINTLVGGTAVTEETEEQLDD